MKKEIAMKSGNFLDDRNSRIWWFCLIVILLLILLNGQSFAQASVSGYAYMDANQNGIQEESERGFSGIRVGLYRRISNEAFQELTSLRTETSGHFIFIIASELLPGDFYLQFEKVPGFYFSPADQGGDDLFDSDPDSSNGRTAPFYLANIINVNGMNAGYMSAPLAPPPPVILPMADLAIIGGTIPDSARIGDELSYSFDVTNFGPDSAKGIQIYFPVSGLIDITNVEPAPIDTSANPLHWMVPDLGEGDLMTFHVDFKILAVGEVREDLCSVTETSESSVSNNCALFSINLRVPVELVSFTGAMAGTGVRLQWVTASETENLGFNVFRSDDEHGPFVQLNTPLIAGAGTSSIEHRYHFIDDDIIRDRTYYYKISDVDYAGQISWHGPIAVATTSPSTFQLDQNYPNPFNAQTRIRFQVGQAAHYELTIYNHLGQQVRNLINQELAPGAHEVRWDGLDNSYLPVSSGNYYYLLRSNDLTQKKSMQLLK